MTDIVVQLPDGTEAHFPEGTSPDTIQSALQAQFGAPKAHAEAPSRIGQAINAVNKGGAGLADAFLDLPQNLWNLSKVGAGLTNLGLNKITGGVIPYDQENYDPSKGFGATDENGQSYHPAMRAAESLGAIQDKYAPTDLQGRLIDAAGQIVGGGGVNPRALAMGAAEGIPSLAGAVVKQALPAAGAAAGKEAMYQVDPNSQAGQLAGALLGGGIGAGAQLIRPSIGSTAYSALKNVSPQQMAQADALLRDSHAMGAPVTGAEALSAAQQGSNPLLRVQRVVENSPGGGPTMDAFMSARQPGAAQAVANVADQISPNMGTVDPLAIPGRVRDASTGALDAAMGHRSAIAKPFYDAARNDKVPVKDVMAYAKMLGQVIGDQGPQTAMGGFLQGMYRKVMPGGFPENRVGVLDNVYKETRDQLDIPAGMDSSVLKSTAGVASPINRQLGDLLTGASPNLAQGRQAYIDATKNIVAPVQNSPVGQIAALGENATPQATAQGIKSALQIDAKPVGIDPNQIKYTANQLSAQDPTALADFAKQHIQNAWDDANKFIRGTVPQFSGARFAQSVAGNQAQRANLTALVEGASGTTAADGLNKVLDVFNAQAKRLEPGSATAFNQQIADELGGGGVANKVAGAASPKAWVDWVEKFRYAKNAKEFADILTSPNSISRLQKVGESFGSRAYRAGKQGAMSGISATRDQFDAPPPATASQP
jgi:hypothetical protein